MFKSQRINIIHNKYWDSVRHWHEESEPYASGEQLQDALFAGWELDKIVFRTEHKLQHSGRHIVFFVVVLWKDGEQCNMPVLVNPYIERLLANKSVHVINVERRQNTIEESAQRFADETPLELHYTQEVAHIG